MPQLLTKPLFLVSAAALVIAAAGLFIWLSVREIRELIAETRAAAITERDAHWQAELQKSNAAAQAAINENLNATMAAQDQARDDIAAAERRATELEKDNAILPDGDGCGVRRERVRLLNKR